MSIVTSDQLHALGRAICAAAEREATLIADPLVEANLAGHNPYGADRRPRVARLEHGMEVDERTWAGILATAPLLGPADRHVAPRSA